MRIAINGAGVAGPTLAYWLMRQGHDVVLFEKAPALRTGGYLIDFWGRGYDIAERMGLRPRIEEVGYHMNSLRMVGDEGEVDASMDMTAAREVMGERLVSIRRGDIASILFDACEAKDVRFGVSVVSFEQDTDGVTVKCSDGANERFDLLIGADGLHSKIRSLLFGDSEEFEYRTGCSVAAFRLHGYRERSEDAYVAHTVPGRQIARVSLRDDETLVLLVSRDEYLPDDAALQDDPRPALRKAFAGVGWEAPTLLDQMDALPQSAVYFDRVAQIRLPRWTKGRVALLGDAAACVSLLGGEGTGLAMVEAYTLAGELAQAEGDHVAAFEAYESRLREHLQSKQKAALRNVGFFVPKYDWSRWARDRMVSLASRPLFARIIAGGMVKDSLSLPEYVL